MALILRQYSRLHTPKFRSCFRISRIIHIQNFSSAIEKNPDFIEYNIDIKTCGVLYEKWRKEKMFRIIPNGNLNFKVKYIDTLNNGITNSKLSPPVVVALHGAPGSYTDFKNLASYLQSKGIRMVVPCFPDFSVYPPGIFRHSAEEKAEFIKDFLSAISVHQIDALVVHSSAVYPGLLLCLNKDPTIKSIVMLNPGAFSYEMRATRHFKVLQFLAKISEVPSILRLLEYIGPHILKMAKVPVRLDNFLDPLLSIVVMVYAGVPKAKDKYMSLVKHKIPILYAFSDNDKLIGKKVSYELAYVLGASDSDIYVHDKDGNLIQNGKEAPLLKVMSFEKGSHYVFWKHEEVIFKAIEDFIAKLNNI